MCLNSEVQRNIFNLLFTWKRKPSGVLMELANTFVTAKVNSMKSYDPVTDEMLKYMWYMISVFFSWRQRLRSENVYLSFEWPPGIWWLLIFMACQATDRKDLEIIKHTAVLWNALWWFLLRTSAVTTVRLEMQFRTERILRKMRYYRP